MFDALLPKVQMILDKTSLEKVLVISPIDSLSWPIQFAYNLKTRKDGRYYALPSDNRYVKFADFIKEGIVYQL